MPLYSYRCSECGALEDAIRKIDERDDGPLHCSMPMQLRIVPTMLSPMFNEYRAIAVERDTGKRPLIKNKAEHEAFLRRNGYQEVGNDKSMAPPSLEELAARAPKPEPVDYDLDLNTFGDATA